MSSLSDNPPFFNAAEGEARRADPLDNLAGRNRAMNGSKQKTWQALEKAIHLVGFASESADIPADLRGELIDVLAGLVWVSQSIRCPACGCWRNKGGEQ
jgi:hypothetical protein